MKYLDEAGLSHLLSKLKDMYALKGEASGSTWHTGTALSGTQSVELTNGEPGISLVPGNFGDPGNDKTATVTLTARRALIGVTISGEFHVEEYYDDFSLIVNGEKIINEGHGERSWQQWWSGSLESGQTIQLIYTKDNSNSGKNEEQTRFEVTCENFRSDSFAIATGSTPVESWTYTVSTGTLAFAPGDYYLNTEEFTLYRCTEASDASSSWDYLCTLGGSGADLSGYATKDDLEDYIPASERNTFATKSELSNYIPATERNNFATKSDLTGYIPITERSNFATKSELSGYIPTAKESSFATKEELGDYIPATERDSFATKAELSDFVTRDELPKGGSTWYTGTMLSGKGDVTRQGTDIHLERAQHYSEGVSLTSAAITLTAQRDLDSVTISGQFYGGGTYDRYNLKVAGADILDATNGTGEKEFCEFWSGSLSSGQTIYLQHLIAVSTVNKREPETYFIVHYDGDPEDFKTSGGTSDRNKWTATFSEENEAYSIGDYYLNTKELTLYRCTQSSEAGSSWKYLCTLGGGG